MKSQNLKSSIADDESSVFSLHIFVILKTQNFYTSTSASQILTLMDDALFQTDT